MSEKLHIALVIYRFFPHGGLQKDFLRTMDSALLRGHRITVLLAEQEADLPAQPDLSVKLLPIKGFSNHSRMKSFAAEVKKEISSGSYDKVLMFNRMPGGDFYFAADNCLATDWAKLHSAWTLKLLPRYRTFLALENAVFEKDSRTHILALTTAQMQDYQNVYQTPSERFTVLPPGIDPACRRSENIEEIRQKIREKFNIPQDAVLLIQVAAQFGVKGVDRSIGALAALPENLRKNTFLLVAGGGDIEQYMLIAGRAGVADKVVFAGASSEIPALISAADLMIHPARKEATGTVIVESLAIGVPVIASAACGYADFTGNIDVQLVTPEPFRQDELNSALVYALENLKLLKIKTLAIAENNPDFYRRSDVILNLLENS